MDDDEDATPVMEWMQELEENIDELDFDEVTNFGLVFTFEDEDGLQSMQGWGISGASGNVYALRAQSEDLTETFRQLVRAPAPNRPEPTGEGFQ